MNNELKIRTLADRFFDGETTLAEEQQLYAYFQQPLEALPSDLRPLREMFLDLASVHYAATLSQQSQQATALRPHWHRWAVAAAVAVVVAGGALLLFNRHAQAEAAEGDCVAYIYGQRTTDRDVVLTEMQKTMMAMAYTGGDTVEEQLKAMFSNE